MQSLKCEIVLDEDILSEFDFNVEYGFDQFIPPVYVQRLATHVPSLRRVLRERTAPKRLTYDYGFKQVA
jgi:hypothetical protein